MRPTCPFIPHLVRLLGTGIMLACASAWLLPPDPSAQGIEPTTNRERHTHRHYRGYHHYWYDKWPRYGEPHRFTIRRGKKCELHCERVWRTHEYRCREYRC